MPIYLDIYEILSHASQIKRKQLTHTNKNTNHTNCNKTIYEFIWTKNKLIYLPAHKSREGSIFWPRLTLNDLGPLRPLVGHWEIRYCYQRISSYNRAEGNYYISRSREVNTVSRFQLPVFMFVYDASLLLWGVLSFSCFLIFVCCLLCSVYYSYPLSFSLR